MTPDVRRYRRKRAERYVVIIDGEGNVLARARRHIGPFKHVAGKRLPAYVLHFSNSVASRGGTRLLRGGYMLHVVPLPSDSMPVLALVFEKTRLRASDRGATILQESELTTGKEGIYRLEDG